MSFWVCFIFIFVAPKDFSACQRVQEPWNMAKIMAKNLENTAKNYEKNLENLEIVKKKLADTLFKLKIALKIKTALAEIIDNGSLQSRS